MRISYIEAEGNAEDVGMQNAALENAGTEM